MIDVRLHPGLHQLLGTLRKQIWALVELRLCVLQSWYWLRIAIGTPVSRLNSDSRCVLLLCDLQCWSRLKIATERNASRMNTSSRDALLCDWQCWSWLRYGIRMNVILVASNQRVKSIGCTMECALKSIHVSSCEHTVLTWITHLELDRLVVHDVVVAVVVVIVVVVVVVVIESWWTLSVGDVASIPSVELIRLIISGVVVPSCRRSGADASWNLVLSAGLLLTDWR